MPDTAAILNEAYGLIEQGELSRARTILQPLLESDSQNPDVWWLYTHAAADENEGRRALDRVMALDPNYPGAEELRQKMGTAPRVLKPISALKPQPTTPTQSTPLPSTETQTSPVLVTPSTVDEPSLDDDFDETGTDAAERRGLARYIVPVGIALLVIAILLFGLSILNQPQTPATPTAIAGLGTDVGTPIATIDPLVATTTLVPELTPLDLSATVDAGTGPTAVVPTTDDPFAQTATALVMPSTLSAQSATEESSPTDASLASVTDEAALTTQQALVGATDESTVEATPDTALVTSEATLELPLTTAESTLEVAMVTQDIAETEETPTGEATVESALPTQEIAATEEPVITEQPAVTQEATVEAVLATEEMLATPEATEALVPPTDEIILPTEDLATQDVTLEITPTDESGLIIPTEAVTAEATQDPLDTLTAKLESLGVTREDIVVAETTLGPTLIVEVCAPPVATATTALTTAMSALAETVGDVLGIQAVGVNLSCEETRPFVIGASAFAAEAYGRGEIDTRTFRQGWAPIELLEPEQEGNG